MSAWRLAAQALYALGGSGTINQLCYERNGLTQLVKFGLATSNGVKGGRQRATWTLTQLGIDWCEGRVVPVCGPHPLDKALADRKNLRPGSFHRPRARATWFIATWLMSLPRDVRITPYPGAASQTNNPLPNTSEE